MSRENTIKVTGEARAKRQVLALVARSWFKIEPSMARDTVICSDMNMCPA
jgi:hypothetical protein